MNAYYLYNSILAVVIFFIAYWLAPPKNKIRDLLIASRISLLMTMMVYPWDFFAIHHRAWAYPDDPGIRLYGVPVNDLIFTWLCTTLAASVLLAVRRRERSG
jgi:lycopene cyclase domain-containing protein